MKQAEGRYVVRLDVQGLIIEQLLPKPISAVLGRSARRLLAALSVLLAAFAAFNVCSWLSLRHHPANLQLLQNHPLAGASLPATSPTTAFCSRITGRNKSCDISKGEWVPDSSPPLYTNDSCRYIFPNQDCMTNGRPDRGFIYWKWQPYGCDLPSFDPTLFLQLMTGKKMVFVGDSLARNHMQALLCALAQVEVPQDLLDHEDMEYIWGFPSYNFTLASAWSPFLVNYTSEDDIWKIHLDKPHKTWTSQVSKYDIAIFSTGYWFFRKSIHYMKNKSISTYDPINVTATTQYNAIQSVWKTVLRHLVNRYKGIAIIRTISVCHFEENTWDKGGVCTKTQPYFDPDMQMPLPRMHDEIYKIQKDEVMRSVVARKNSTLMQPATLKLLDVTYSTLLRPDGHPGAYRIQSSTEPRNDCGHWCLPGPIDMWNQLLFADPEIMCS